MLEWLFLAHAILLDIDLSNSLIKQTLSQMRHFFPILRNNFPQINSSFYIKSFMSKLAN